MVGDEVRRTALRYRRGRGAAREPVDARAGLRIAHEQYTWRDEHRHYRSAGAGGATDREGTGAGISLGARSRSPGDSGLTSPTSAGATVTDSTVSLISRR